LKKFSLERRIPRRVVALAALLATAALGNAQIQVSVTGPIHLTYTGAEDSYASAPVGVVVSSSVRNWRVFGAIDPISTPLGPITSKQMIAAPVVGPPPPPNSFFFSTTGSLSEFKAITNGTLPMAPSTTGAFTLSIAKLNPLTPVGTLTSVIRFYGRIGPDPTMIPLGTVPVTITVRPYLTVAFAEPNLAMVARNPGVWNMLGRTKFTVRSNMPSASVEISMSQLKNAPLAAAIPKTLTSINWGTNVTDLKAKLTAMPLGMNSTSLTVPYGVTNLEVGAKIQTTWKHKPGTYLGQLTMTASGA
jgi:hypothetical protein